MADPDVTATASAAEVEAAQKAMGCSRQEFVTRKGPPEVVCRMHQEYAPDFKSILAGEWTDRGCPVAVTVADAVVAAAQPRIAADDEDPRLPSVLFNDVTRAPTYHHIRFSERRAIADHLWVQGWRRAFRPEDVTERQS